MPIFLLAAGAAFLTSFVLGVATRVLNPPPEEPEVR